MKYTVIKNDKQYYEYCEVLETLVDNPALSKEQMEEMEMLQLLIDHYDGQQLEPVFADPVEIIKAIIRENGLKAADLSQILQVSPGLISDIFNYKKGLSKEMIRKISSHFKISQEALNRPYPLNPRHRKDQAGVH
jgi:HTH-type transcriptional regulator / antitoxin HigA